MRCKHCQQTLTHGTRHSCRVAGREFIMTSDSFDVINTAANVASSLDSSSDSSSSDSSSSSSGGFSGGGGDSGGGGASGDW